MKRVFKNALNPILDDGGHKLGGVAIKAGQEGIYSKIIRKVMKRDTRSWMNLVVFSLLTSAFDDGLGAWYSSKKDFIKSEDQKISDVLKEFPRPRLSCLAIRWIMETAKIGFHNPMRTFSFRELLIAQAAKDMAGAGNMILRTRRSTSHGGTSSRSSSGLRPGSSANLRATNPGKAPIYFPTTPNNDR